MTDFLYARPSVLRGLTYAFDLFGFVPEYNFSQSDDDSDRRAFNADMMALKADMNRAFDKVVKPCPTK